MYIPETLLTKILNGRCILFLGAGATKKSGGLLGSELSKHIYNELGDTGINYNDNLARYTQSLVNSGYREDIEHIIRTRLSSLSPTPEFSQIASIPWKAIYTTNYDSLIEKSYSKQHFYNCVVNSPQATQQCHGSADIPVYKINGDINIPFQEDNPLVITLNDLRDNKSKNEKMILQLMNDMNDTFIFIGYSFQDDSEIVTSILDAFKKSSRWESVKEKYVILPTISDDIQLDLESYKITYLSGTADDFFAEVGEKAQNNFRTKLSALKNTFSSNNFLKNMQPRTLQYINDCFYIYNSDKHYPADSKHYYHGGQPDWGIIKNHFDINRDIDITDQEHTSMASTTDSLYYHIQGLLNNATQQIVLLQGTAVSGKSTTLYRCAYDLLEHDTLAMIFKQQATYKEGLISTIYDAVKEPFVILMDDIFIDMPECIKMKNEAARKSLPVLFILSTRYSDWKNNVNNYYKNVLSPYTMEINMRDSFNKDEAANFVERLKISGIINITNEFERKGYMRDFEKNNNIIQILIELADNNEIIRSISREYDTLCDETKYAYGIVSLVYKYGLKTRWEILQRTIADKYNFTWEDFTNKILRNDAQGNLYDDEIQGKYYILGRHRYISELIVQIHYGGNYSDEILAIKSMINACAGLNDDERFIGGLIHSILKDENNYYTEDQIIDLLNHAINLFENPHNSSFINHMKGEYYLSIPKYEPALRCFEANVQNELNEEYSIHSLGKTYFYMAQHEDPNSGEFRIHIDIAIDKLLSGVKIFKDNVFYYALLISIFSYLENVDKMSEKNQKAKNDTKKFAMQYIGSDEFNKLIAEKNSRVISME